ncbi:MAG: hypothetical protein ABSF10_06445 [Verrucomicrobiota bacterium]
MARVWAMIISAPAVSAVIFDHAFSATSLRPAIQRMLDAREPYVLDVIVPYTEHVLPFVPANRTVADMIWKA